MPQSWTALPVFPSNGLDRSLHAPVFIGLLLISFFKETLGWTYAGLVVPGYLATVFLSAPVTGILVAAESLLTYAISALLGRVLPRTGAWFTFFGRERFLLIIVVALFVRLVVEASLIPVWIDRLGLGHSRELYSLGLVLVPLLANSYWNAGVVRALPRVCVITLITYLVVSKVLLRYTNFTLSRFQVANESVSLAFLESPHAHIILLMGAILGARNNVRYGWDYNGILVPALLAVAWYQPSKILATVVEALVVFKLSLWILKLPGFSKILVVGSRRLAVTFAVGFLVKYVMGFVLLWLAPQVQMVDTFGFGYLLPSLMAVKFWDKQKILRVLMPTLQVSMMAFPLGIAVGYVLRWVSPPAKALAQSAQSISIVEDLGLELMKADSAPAPQRTGAAFKQAGTYGAALALASDARAGDYEVSLRRALGLHLAVGQTAPGDWLVIAPQSTDPNEDAFGPRFALRTQHAYGDAWLVVVEADAVGSAIVPIAADVGERLGAAAIVVRSRLVEVQQSDDAFIVELMRALETDKLLVVGVASDEDAPSRVVLDVIGEVPVDLSPKALERRLHVAIQTRTRVPAENAGLLARAARLEFPAKVAEEAGASLLQAQPLEHWEAHSQSELNDALQALVGTEPEQFRQPSFAELRLYRALVSRRLDAGTRAPDSWERALAHALGLTFADVDATNFRGWALYEPLSATRHGAATWLQRTGASTGALGALVYVEAPRWEAGVLGAGTTLAWANAVDGVLVHGALAGAELDGSSDVRRVTGRQAFFQSAYEAWVSHGGHALAVRAMDPVEQPTTPLVVTFDSEVVDLSQGPAWASDLIAPFTSLGIGIAPYDGTAERAGFSASGDPSIAFGRRFAPASTVMLWLRQDLRMHLSQLVINADTATRERTRFLRLGIELDDSFPSERVARIEDCAIDPETDPRCERLIAPGQCQASEARTALELVQRFSVTQNPYTLVELRRVATACGLAVLAPDGPEPVWLSFWAPANSESPSSVLFFPLRRERWSDEVRRVSPEMLGEAQRLPLVPLEVSLP